MSKKDKRDEIKFGPKTDVGLHRRFAEKEGLSICELHQTWKDEQLLEVVKRIRKEQGIELLTREELTLMINELSAMEKEMSNMETSQLLTIIHQGYGKLPDLAVATLLKVKKEGSYEIIKKLRKLYAETEDDNTNNAGKSDISANFPQLDPKHKELDDEIQGLQGIVKDPKNIENEIANREISQEERPEPASEETRGESEEKKESKEKEEEKSEKKDEIKLLDRDIRNSLSTVKLLENLKAANIDDRLGMDFLLELPRQKIWNRLCENTEETLTDLRNSLKKSNGNVKKLIEQVLREYEKVTSMKLPEGYNENWVDEKGKKLFPPRKPFLMQIYETWLIKEQKSRLNLSDPGAGKTLAAVLASQAIGSKLTLVFSPRNVIDSWTDAFKNSFPSLEVKRQTWSPKWDESGNKVLIMNYERLKTDPKTHNQIMYFAQNAEVDFVILDETHIAKQRGTLETISNEKNNEDNQKNNEDEKVSARRRELETLLIELRRKNKEMRIYGLTASPALNDLTEPITLLSLINPGKDVSGMNHLPNIPNGLKVHQQLTMVSTRWRQSENSKSYRVYRKLVKVNISDKLEDLINDSSFHPITQEQHSVDGKIKELRKILADGIPTIIYVHHVEGIIEKIRDRLLYFGYSVGTYYGSEKSGLKPFINGENQVLIASMSAIGTGFDGLQNRCSRAVFFALPWTYELRKQSEARIARTGQLNDCEFITLEAYYEVNHPKITSKDNIWSWDKDVAKLIHSKREMSDLVVDGEIPNSSTESLISQAQKGRLLWIERLKELGGITYKKEILTIPIIFKNEIEKRKVLGKFGNDFSQINAKWNSSLSKTVFNRIQGDPSEWYLYHTHYNKNSESWNINPVKEVIKQMKNYSELVIGDFGCGEAKLAKEISDKSKVLNFDLHAIDDSVIECNIADNIPIAPNTLDIAIFCLSLMFKDWKNMLLNVRGKMKANGQLIVWNPKSKIEEEELKKAIIDAGFKIIEVDNSISIEPFIKILAIVDPGTLI